MSIPGWFRGAGDTGFGYNSTATQVAEGVDLKGKTILLTGCNAGIGQETLRVLAERGARVLALARTVEKAQAALVGLPGEHVAVACELSEPTSVLAAVETVRADGQPLAAMICNAGIMALPERQTSHGYELQFFTNHMGHFLLVTGLIDQLATDGRVVMLSSSAHGGAPAEGIRFHDLSADKEYAAWSAYGQSKLANILFAKALSRRLPHPDQTANAVHPGVIYTALVRHMNPAVQVLYPMLAPLWCKSLGQGAATQVYVAIHPDAGKVSGEYWADVNVARPSRNARDEALAERLWVESERIAAELAAST